MVVGAKVCELTEDLLWFVRGLCVGILTSPLTTEICWPHFIQSTCQGNNAYDHK